MLSGNPTNASKPSDSPVASPCNSVCTIERVSGLCAGCYRTLDEIAKWSTLADAEKRRIIAELPLRKPSPSPGKP